MDDRSIDWDDARVVGIVAARGEETDASIVRAGPHSIERGPIRGRSAWRRASQGSAISSGTSAKPVKAMYSASIPIIGLHHGASRNGLPAPPRRSPRRTLQAIEQDLRQNISSVPAPGAVPIPRPKPTQPQRSHRLCSESSTGGTLASRCPDLFCLAARCVAYAPR